MVRGLVAAGFGYSLLNFCPPGDRLSQAPVVSLPQAARLRVPSLAFARLYRARTLRIVEELHAQAAAVAAAIQVDTPLHQES